MNAALRIRGLRCSYAGTTVLHDLTASVDKGTTTIIIGPNGSGKSTLIKAIAGLMPISAGEILIHDKPLKRYGHRELARRVAYVAQQTADDTFFTVRQLVLMGRSPYLGILGIEGESDLAIARQAMIVTGIDHLADRAAVRLSGGERQRVQIARAICQQPDLILLDEPTAALDLAHQVRIMEVLAELRRSRGTTVVMVSHDINLAAMYADRLLLLVDGHISAVGAPESVIDANILSRAYGCALSVDRNPAGPWPRVSLLRRQ